MPTETQSANLRNNLYYAITCLTNHWPFLTTSKHASKFIGNLQERLKDYLEQDDDELLINDLSILKSSLIEYIDENVSLPLTGRNVKHDLEQLLSEENINQCKSCDLEHYKQSKLTLLQPSDIKQLPIAMSISDSESAASDDEITLQKDATPDPVEKTDQGVQFTLREPSPVKLTPAVAQHDLLDLSEPQFSGGVTLAQIAKLRGMPVAQAPLVVAENPPVASESPRANIVPAAFLSKSVFAPNTSMAALKSLSNVQAALMQARKDVNSLNQKQLNNDDQAVQDSFNGLDDYFLKKVNFQTNQLNPYYIANNLVAYPDLQELVLGKPGPQGFGENGLVQKYLKVKDIVPMTYDDIKSSKFLTQENQDRKETYTALKYEIRMDLAVVGAKIKPLISALQRLQTSADFASAKTLVKDLIGDMIKKFDHIIEQCEARFKTTLFQSAVKQPFFAASVSGDDNVTPAVPLRSVTKHAHDAVEHLPVEKQVSLQQITTASVSKHTVRFAPTVQHDQVAGLPITMPRAAVPDLLSEPYQQASQAFFMPAPAKPKRAGFLSCKNKNAESTGCATLSCKR